VRIFKEDLNKYVGSTMTFSGILTDVQHKTSQNGNEWGSFTVVDYSDSHEFRIFKDDYLKFKPYLFEDAFRQIRVSVTAGWRTKEGNLSEPRVNFTDIQILQDVLEKQTKKITISLDINKIDKFKVEEIHKIIKENEGNVPVDFIVYDLSENVKLNLHSRSFKVKVDNAFLKILKNEEIHFKLN
jgi:DNA polymerase-3 subunit alpha